MDAARWSNLQQNFFRLDGDEDAAAGLFAHYANRLTALAEGNLNKRLAGRIQGEYVIQSVFRSFFTRSSKGDFAINNSEDLWRLLVRITLAKTRSQARRHTAEKRDVNAEHAGAEEEQFYQMLAREPGPAEAAALVDLVEVALAGLPETYGEILGLRLEGHIRTEIAKRLKISRQTVYRALSLIKQRVDDTT